MKKFFFLFTFSFLFFLACDKQNEIIEPEKEDTENWQEPNPPVVIVDSTLVIISDTIKVSF